jgi:hypothetical protein
MKNKLKAIIATIITFIVIAFTAYACTKTSTDILLGIMITVLITVVFLMIYHVFYDFFNKK